eukprot:TRINITY_DN1847_c1_g1_i1.p1 TRINITY_DN1847_c1_g1~~TRINITY_DN1847_c1_g1_i1.p1  ORF type:complete len:852 (-),score=290.12 TRINITY_DN1847_c1_g1_i1:6-2561(-)
MLKKRRRLSLQSPVYTKKRRTLVGYADASLSMEDSEVKPEMETNSSPDLPSMKDQSSPPTPTQSSSSATVQTPLKEVLAKKRIELLKFRHALPIWSTKETLISQIKSNESLVIIGETGSGKTTQIPQFVFEANGMKKFYKRNEKISKLQKCGIAVTQPRKLAAVSVSSRVAEEMGVKLGELVGYHVRFDNKTSPTTRITFLTDGMLLREAMLDPLLSKYHTVILDEAHERSLHTDVLFALLKDLQKKRNLVIQNNQDTNNNDNNDDDDDGGDVLPPLKIIIMSATLEAELFEKYFSAKVLYVMGRQYPVQIFYTKVPEPNYIDAMLITILQIHLNEDEDDGGSGGDGSSSTGDILAFLTGRNEIESLDKLLKSKSKLLPPNAKKLLPCPLFGAQNSGRQQRVFEPTPPGCRKVVLATNIAETSVTVPSIKYVVDCGMLKARMYYPKIGMDILSIVPVAQAQARQRAGRAGRTQPGQCYRIYTENDFLKLSPSPVPEIYRINLASVILTLKMIGIDNVLDFDYIEKPPIESFQRALSDLWLLGALNKDGTISELGKKMSMFPLEPTFSKVLILSREFNCSVETLIITAMLSVENLLLGTSSISGSTGGGGGSSSGGGGGGGKPNAKKNQQDSSNTNNNNDDEELPTSGNTSSFSSRYGDHIMLLRIYLAFEEEKGNKKDWCIKNNINFKAMKKVLDVHKQLTEYWKSLNWPLVSCQQQRHDGFNMSNSDSFDPVRKCFASGFFTRVAVLMPNGSYETMLDHKRVHIHPSSCLFMKKPDVVIYNELVLTTKEYMRDVLKIEKEWVLELQPEFQRAKLNKNKQTNNNNNSTNNNNNKTNNNNNNKKKNNNTTVK